MGIYGRIQMKWTWPSASTNNTKDTSNGKAQREQL